MQAIIPLLWNTIVVVLENASKAVHSVNHVFTVEENNFKKKKKIKLNYDLE